MVQNYNGDTIEVLFDSLGHKVLSLGTVLELGLLERL